jgi:hypothetical protein
MTFNASVATFWAAIRHPSLVVKTTSDKALVASSKLDEKNARGVANTFGETDGRDWHSARNADSISGTACPMTILNLWAFSLSL